LSITFNDFRIPRHVEAAVAHSSVGFKDNKDGWSGGQSIRWTVMTAVATYASRSLFMLAVIDRDRVEQAGFLFLDTHPHEVYSDDLATTTDSHKIYSQQEA